MFCRCVQSMKSVMEQRWMFGVLYQVLGREAVTGIRPPMENARRTDQWAKLGKETMEVCATRSMSVSVSMGLRSVWSVFSRMAKSKALSTSLAQTRLMSPW